MRLKNFAALQIVLPSADTLDRCFSKQQKMTVEQIFIEKWRVWSTNGFLSSHDVTSASFQILNSILPRIVGPDNSLVNSIAIDNDTCDDSLN